MKSTNVIAGVHTRDPSHSCPYTIYWKVVYGVGQGSDRTSSRCSVLNTSRRRMGVHSLHAAHHGLSLHSSLSVIIVPKTSLNGGIRILASMVCHTVFHYPLTVLTNIIGFHLTVLNFNGNLRSVVLS